MFLSKKKGQTPMLLSPRFEHALQYATIIHAGQMRKGSDVPYIAHLLAVTSIALEHGANEDEAIAALLHDAAEDAGGRKRVNDIRVRFGDTVADLVISCTDTMMERKPEWRSRKEAYVGSIQHKSTSELLITASDKLHNSQSILRDYRELGDDVWERFSSKKEGTLWYYRALANAFMTAPNNTRCKALVEEINRVVTTIEDLYK
jgi:(p)ppGpp synthase/HD superfamily hydrolase